MRFSASILIILISFPFTATDSFAQLVVPRIERNEGDQASPRFQFPSIAAPSSTDAAGQAKWFVVRGQVDPASGPITTLFDGKTPPTEDAPNSNFFLAQGETGARIAIDLGDSKEVKRISSYSWHPSTRGGQRYNIYGVDTDEANFQTLIKSDQALSESAWQWIAEVDTAKSFTSTAGQFAVEMAKADNQAIGTFRYILLDIQPGDTSSRFGNTFFSEFDIDDGQSYQAQITDQNLVDVLVIQNKYEIKFDCRETPQLKAWVDKELKPICEVWYPKIVDLLPSDGYNAPTKFSIQFHADMEGVAYATGTEIHCAAPWFRGNLRGEALGAVVHEMVHIVQQYPRRQAGRERVPSWLVEGIADYIRWTLYEPPQRRRKQNLERANYTDSYAVTGAFLAYCVSNHDPDIVLKLNAAIRQGKYRAGIWEEITGKTVDQLWETYAKPSAN